MDYRQRTGVAFGTVEAYADRHRRIAPVVGTSINISLQETGADEVSRSPLLDLIEGAPLTLELLRDVLPSLASRAWLFGETADHSGYRLSTTSDQISVTLSIAAADSLPASIEIEGALRGLAARLIVALSY
ncbi:hypothetical protein BZM26_37235 [Paraburkholderia strydomiana]|nr:hypothetical protein BZM26_37235 [Paraburkholderia strydomiana]